MSVKQRIIVGIAALTVGLLLLAAALSGVSHKTYPARGQTRSQKLASVLTAGLSGHARQAPVIGVDADRDGTIDADTGKANGVWFYRIVTSWSDADVTDLAKQQIALGVCAQARALWKGAAISVLSRTEDTVFGDFSPP